MHCGRLEQGAFVLKFAYNQTSTFHNVKSSIRYMLTRATECVVHGTRTKANRKAQTASASLPTGNGDSDQGANVFTD
jgi:hypothetical protein